MASLEITVTPCGAASYRITEHPEIILPTTIDSWSRDTLNWTIDNAKKTGSPYVSTASLGITLSLDETAYLNARKDKDLEVYDQLVKATKLGTTVSANHYWFFNHPEFDVPFLDTLWMPLNFRALVGHSNVYDMRSALLGYGLSKKQTYNLAAASVSSHRAAHTALADAISQLTQLIRSGVADRIAHSHFHSHFHFSG